MAALQTDTRVEDLLSHCAPNNDAQGAECLLLTLPAPSLASHQVAALLEHFDVATLYRPQRESLTLAVGTVAAVEAAGPTRFTEIRNQASELLQRCRTISVDAAPQQQARFFGGFAFHPKIHDPVWQPFGAASFTLPRLRYDVSPGAVSSVSILLPPSELSQESAMRKRLDELLKFRGDLQRLAQRTDEAPVAGESPIPQPVDDAEDAAQRAEYFRQVGDILTAIESGQLVKAVAARRALQRFDKPIALDATVAALEQQNDASTTFCFKRGRDAFVGATPETLVRKVGASVWSEALAGTFRLQSNEFAAELLRSPKEHAEHAPVLEAIVSALRPFCDRVSHPPKPIIRELRHMLHLLTPIEASLDGAHHVLDLLAALHPTPAVGGVPSGRAVDWIAVHEECDRGWYSGPIGWFDAAGDGEFRVALRSGLIRGGNAYLYAGAGIVRGSVAEDEYRETELKLHSLRSSLRTQ